MLAGARVEAGEGLRAGCRSASARARRPSSGDGERATSPRRSGSRACGSGSPGRCRARARAPGAGPAAARELVQHARLGERPRAVELALAQEAEPARVEAVEAAHGGDGHAAIVVDIVAEVNDSTPAVSATIAPRSRPVGGDPPCRSPVPSSMPPPLRSRGRAACRPGSTRRPRCSRRSASTSCSATGSSRAARRGAERRATTARSRRSAAPIFSCAARTAFCARSRTTAGTAARCSSRARAARERLICPYHAWSYMLDG